MIAASIASSSSLYQDPSKLIINVHGHQAKERDHSAYACLRDTCGLGLGKKTDSAAQQKGARPQCISSLSRGQGLC